ncbi:type II toxin-antitoxin system RelB/DinJ family antitoxin [Streptococcus didelphis]|uniref:Type II toxin-antitoxin system RelB/DinJ family antitoxin n=1 Tax=Streptococcus didelphis TaxID=102886 RepID=A0ABY9LGE0_9STRE|nr:type II toxin-antitoxin system RelB/DinJ family antitoxin [Streptococcus didelphis]WMB27927.1 type II toxin-antitoxin system RelB/DinJ family antitoxin [Streptococcus didelphis]WMB30136.1 type II toxin-antitoxin system RelB/DinJ family antitoxin [Streptococcus didelphis]
MGKTATINVRVDESDKKSAEQVLKQLGMPMSTLITLLLKQVSLTKSVPFDITLPEAPSSVSVDQISVDEFGQMMVGAYQESETGQVRSANEFFKEFRERHA